MNWCKFILFCLLLPFTLITLPTACKSSPNTNASGADVRQRLGALAQSFGAVAMQTYGTAAINKYAPHLIPILDVNQDKTIQLEELMALDFEDPAILSMTILAIEDAIKNRK